MLAYPKTLYTELQVRFGSQPKAQFLWDHTSDEAGSICAKGPCPSSAPQKGRRVECVIVHGLVIGREQSKKKGVVQK